MRKEAKKCISYYLENINSEEYKSHKLKNDNQNRGAQQEYTERGSHENEPFDYYDDAIVSGVSIGDVLSNVGVTKLLRRIYMLPKSKFKVSTSYKKPTIISKYDYIHLQYLHSKYGRFAEIELLEDSYIKEIVIFWVQINSYYAFLEYNFILKKWLDDELYDQFIYDNIQKLNSKDYTIWYHISKQKNKNFLMLEQMKDDYFSLIFQHYITSYLYSEQGKTSQLLNLIHMTRNKPLNVDTLYLCGIELAYYNRETNLLISSEFDKTVYYLYGGNGHSSHFGVCKYISEYGNEFYNRFFGNRELRIFETEFSKFVTGRKKITYNKELKKLLNKMQSLSEIENKEFGDFYKKYSNNWVFYVFGNKMNLEEFHVKSTARIQKIYKDNFEYLKVLTEMNYTKSGYINSLVATFVAIMAVIISVISLLIQK